MALACSTSMLLLFQTVGIHECHESDGLRTLNSARKQQINVSTQQQVQELTARNQTTAKLMHYWSKNQL